MTIIPDRVISDPTLDAINASIEEEQTPYASQNIGFGLIGHECSRHIWYKIHELEGETFDANTLRIFRSGHEAEAAMAEDLRRVDGVELYTHDPERGNKQYKYDFLAGRLTGRLDGVIVGLKQAPKTPHIWEHKEVNEKKFKELVKCQNLKEWDTTYYAQAQIAMLAAELDRHYLTCSTQYLRQVTSVRTVLDKAYAESLVTKANRIINAKDPPERIGDSTWYRCRFCSFHGACHGV